MFFRFLILLIKLFNNWFLYLLTYEWTSLFSEINIRSIKNILVHFWGGGL